MGEDASGRLSARRKKILILPVKKLLPVRAFLFAPSRSDVAVHLALAAHLLRAGAHGSAPAGRHVDTDIPAGHRAGWHTDLRVGQQPRQLEHAARGLGRSDGTRTTRSEAGAQGRTGRPQSGDGRDSVCVYTHAPSGSASVPGILARTRVPRCCADPPGVRRHPGQASEPWERGLRARTAGEEIRQHSLIGLAGEGEWRASTHARGPVILHGPAPCSGELPGGTQHPGWAFEPRERGPRTRTLDAGPHRAARWQQPRLAAALAAGVGLATVLGQASVLAPAHHGTIMILDHGADGGAPGRHERAGQGPRTSGTGWPGRGATAVPIRTGAPESQWTSTSST